jgi:hypothetical protein
VNKRVWLSILGGVLVLIGGVWLFQGVGMIGGSFMTGEPLWVVIGGVVALAGAWLLVSNLQGRRGRSG